MDYKQAIIVLGNLPIYADGCYSIGEYQVAKNIAMETMAYRDKVPPRDTTIFEGESAKKLSDSVTNYRAFKCPRCNGFVASKTFSSFLHPNGYDTDNFCRKCGQGISWEGVFNDDTK